MARSDLRIIFRALEAFIEDMHTGFNVDCGYSRDLYDSKDRDFEDYTSYGHIIKEEETGSLKSAGFLLFLSHMGIEPDES